MNLECTLYGLIPDTKLSRLLEMLKGITGSNPKQHAKHELVYKPKVETPFGPARNDDVILCLQSELLKMDDYVPFKSRSWTLLQKGHPEPPKIGQKLANIRLILKSAVEGNCLKFMDELGYEFLFEFVTKGYEFMINGITILVFQIYKLPEEHVVKTAEVIEQENWIVHALAPLCLQEQIQAWSQQLFKLASQLDALVSLKVVDHNSLAQKIKYSD